MNRRPPRSGEKQEKIQSTLLVDGNALFKTAFFGAKDQYNQKGYHVGGLYQFLTTLRMLLDREIYHRVYVFWDGDLSGYLRYEIYEPYKSSRGKDYKNGTHPTDESELIQRQLVRTYLSEMYIRQMMDEVIEGDDFIAHYCLNKSENEEVTICTNDRDMAQLIGDNVRVYFLDWKNYVDKDNFSSYFCYYLENAALIKTMVGDTSDTIKGIKGLGLPSLVKYFPDLRTKKVSLTEIIDQAKNQQEERIKSKKKPLVVLDNIINCITDGVQGKKMYEINERLVNLKKPMLTESGKLKLKDLMEGYLTDDRDINKVQKWMKRDGLDKIIGEARLADYLTPFKRLIEREKIIF